MKTKDGVNIIKVYWRVMTYVKSQKVVFVYSILAFLFMAYYSIYNAKVQERFINAMNTGSLDSFVGLSIRAALFLIVGSVICYTGFCTKCLVAPYMAKDMSADAFHKLNKIPMDYIRENHSGDIVRRIGKETTKSTKDFELALHQYMIDAILMVAIFIFLANYNIFVAAITVISAPAMLFVSRFFSNRIRKNMKNILKGTGTMSGLIQESVKNMTTIRSYCLEDAFCEKFINEKNENNKMYFKNALTGNFMDILNSIISNSGVYISVFLIGSMAIEGKISIGAVMAVIVLIQRVQWSFIDISNRWGKMVEGVSAADRIFEIMDQKTEEEAFYRSQDKNEVSANAISIQNVNYSYKLGNDDIKEIFENLSIEVKYGETFAVVGLSGAGKSTLAKLMLGLLAPDSGYVSVCGHKTTGELELARKNMAYIPQIPYLFKGSIEQNISYGGENATKDEIIDAAKSAFAHDFILKLKDKYDTDVGEHGAKLSGGERQRVAIARAFLKNAPIIVFDEATSSLDNESERFIQDSIESKQKNRTMIIIAHRLSTIKNADRIIVLENGKIAEEGSHDELMNKNGGYRKLYEYQTI